MLHENRLLYLVLTAYAFMFIVFGFCMDSPERILFGLRAIVLSPDILITDYCAVGGIGAGFVNAGVLTLISIGFLFLLKMEINGLSIATVFLISGFALFGKNIANVWPIFFGVFLYSRVRKEAFSKYIYTALLATSMAPAIVEIVRVIPLPFGLGLSISILCGVSIGFVIPPIAVHMLKFHQGYNLYNIGFTSGIVGTIFVSVLKSYGYETRSNMMWSEGNNLLFSIFLSLLFLLFILVGLSYNHRSLGNLKNLFRSHGQLGSDFLKEFGTGTTFINIGMNGFCAMLYILIVRGELNGPTIGGIITVAGFGAYGKHLKNIVPVLLGVVIGGVTKIWTIDEPRILIGALFGTALAPIAGRYGWLLGMVAGFINSSVVLSVGVLHGGINLYNTGFSSGIVAAVMIPVIEAFERKKESEVQEDTEMREVQEDVELTEDDSEFREKLEDMEFIVDSLE